MRKFVSCRALSLLLILLLCALPLAAGAEGDASIALADTPLTLEQIQGDILAAFPDEDAARLQRAEDVYVSSKKNGFLVQCSVRHAESASRSSYALHYLADGVCAGLSRKITGVAQTAFLTDETEIRAAARAFLDAYLADNLPADYPLDALNIEGGQPVWDPGTGYSVGFSIVMPAASALSPAGWNLSLFWSADYNCFTATAINDWPLETENAVP